MSKSAWLAILAAFALNGVSFYYIVHKQAADRRSSVVEFCTGQNNRNRNTIAEYDTRIAKIAPKLPPAQRAQLKQSRDFTVGLINALTPVRNCTDVLHRAGFN